jgi:hypothetical protein
MLPNQRPMAAQQKAARQLKMNHGPPR